MTTGHYICAVRKKIYKKDILQTGLELMFLNGYHATGIKEITDSIGIPKGSFYNHFKSKEQFGLEVLEQYCKNGVKLHEEMLLKSERSAIERLENMYSQMIEKYKNELGCKLGCLMSNFSAELSDVNEQFAALLEHQFKQIENIIAQCLQEARDTKEINTESNPSQLAAFILNSWHGALIRMKSSADIKPLDDFKHLIFNTILK